MRVLHVISSLEIGGAQRLLSDIIPIQKRQGIDVSLLVLKTVDNVFNQKIIEAGVPIISFDVKSFRNPFLAFKVRPIIKRYDVVHAHLVHSLYLCSLAATGLKIKLVYTEHSTSNNRRGKAYLRPVEKLIYGHYSKLISISKQTEDALQEWLQSNDERFVVINNGVNTKAFSSIHREIIPKSLIMVSRFASSKDQETVIRALKLLDKDVTIRFVGDGDKLDHCKHVAKGCGVEDRAQFLGSRDDVANLIAESYIGIQSSNWEGFGLSAVEIMACGKPIIATNVDGLKQVVEGAGELFTVGDYKALAGIIKKINENKFLYDKMSAASKERATMYDITETANHYIETYKKIMYE